MRNTILLITILVLLCTKAGAQLYTGFTLDYGNRVRYSQPDPSYLLKRSGAFSGSIALVMQNNFKNDWHIRYGISAGSFAYIVKSFPYDSVPGRSYEIYDRFPAYETLYISPELTVGKSFHIVTRPITLYIGGGVTKYRDFLQTGSASIVNPDGSYFSFETSTIGTKEKGFMNFGLETSIRERILIGVRYRHHFGASATGTYLFPMAKSSGSINVMHRTISISVLFRLTTKNRIGSI